MNRLIDTWKDRYTDKWIDRQLYGQIKRDIQIDEYIYNIELQVYEQIDIVKENNQSSKSEKKNHIQLSLFQI